MLDRRTPGTRDDRARSTWLVLFVPLAFSCSLVGCAIPFGPGQNSESSIDMTAEQRNRLYLQEQEYLERQRQTFQPIRPSER